VVSKVCFFKCNLYRYVWGGTTMFPGIADRMSKEITALAPSSMKIKAGAVQVAKSVDPQLESAWFPQPLEPIK
jgi:hypothetical protein